MFRKSNAKLFAISPQLPEQSREIIVKNNLNFEILHDSNNAYTQKLDIVHGFPADLKHLYLNTFGIDLEAANGENNWRLAMPARIVVDSEHRIKSIDVNASYTVRPEPDETLKIVMS